MFLGLVTVVLLVTVSGSLAGLEYKRGRDAALTEATERMRSFSASLVDRFHILFGGTVVSVGRASVSEAFPEAPPNALDAKIGFLSKLASFSANVDGAYAGYPDRSFIHVVHLEEDDRWRAVLDAPESAGTAIRLIEVGAGGQGLSRWTFLDGAGRTAGQDGGGFCGIRSSHAVQHSGAAVPGWILA